MNVLEAIGHALALAGSMTWEITWALILGFLLSAIVQALVPKETITRLIGDDRPKTLAIATGLGAASSSCSYAAVALARSLFRKGAHFTAAMAFEIASTNLVIELGIILALLFRALLRPRLLEEARRQADRGLAGSMEGHAAMDMRAARVEMAQVSWNYTTFLNIAFLALAAVLVVRFFKTGGREMLAMMGSMPTSPPASTRTGRTE